MSNSRFKTLELTALGIALCFLLVVLGYATQRPPEPDTGEESTEAPRD